MGCLAMIEKVNTILQSMIDYDQQMKNFGYGFSVVSYR